MGRMKKLRRTELRSEKITIRTFPSYCEWMNKKKLSPSRIFNKAVKDLMEKRKWH